MPLVRRHRANPYFNLFLLELSNCSEILSPLFLIGSHCGCFFNPKESSSLFSSTPAKGSANDQPFRTTVCAFSVGKTHSCGPKMKCLSNKTSYWKQLPSKMQGRRLLPEPDGLPTLDGQHTHPDFPSKPKSGSVWKSPPSRAPPSLQRRWYCSPFPPRERGNPCDWACVLERKQAGMSVRAASFVSQRGLRWMFIRRKQIKMFHGNGSATSEPSGWIFQLDQRFRVHQEVEPPGTSISRLTPGGSGSVVQEMGSKYSYPTMYKGSVKWRIFVLIILKEKNLS